jgi:MFS family permease
LCFTLGISGFVALLPAIQTSLHADLTQTSTLVGVTSISMGCGQLLFAGFFVDHCGPRYASIWSAVLISTCAICVACSRSFNMVVAFSGLTDFFSTTMWPAHVQLVRTFSDSLEAESRALWKLGIASRSGAVLAQIIYGSAELWIGWRATEGFSSLSTGAVLPEPP